MIPPECVANTDVSRIKVEECGRKAVILNIGKQEFVVVKVDGCAIIGETAADWIVSKPGLGAVVIELKGKDVSYGSAQILETAENLKDEQVLDGKLAGLIVAKQYPRITTTIQKAKTRFAKRFNGPLHVVTKNYEFEFERLLSFQGPL